LSNRVSQAANIQSKPKPGGLSVVRPEILFGDSKVPSSSASNHSSASQINPLSLLSNLTGFPPGLNLLNNLKSLEASEEKASQKEETSSEQIRVLTAKQNEAEARAEFAERSVQKLQKEVDRLEDEFRAEQERNKILQDDMEAALQDIQ